MESRYYKFWGVWWSEALFFFCSLSFELYKLVLESGLWVDRLEVKFMLFLNKSVIFLVFLILLELCWIVLLCFDFYYFFYVSFLLFICLVLLGCFDFVYGFRFFGIEMLKYFVEVFMYYSLYLIDIWDWDGLVCYIIKIVFS